MRFRGIPCGRYREYSARPSPSCVGLLANPQPPSSALQTGAGKQFLADNVSLEEPIRRVVSDLSQSRYIAAGTALSALFSGQYQTHRCTFPLAGTHAHRTTVTFDNDLHQGQPQPCACDSTGIRGPSQLIPDGRQV